MTGHAPAPAIRPPSAFEEQADQVVSVWAVVLAVLAAAGVYVVARNRLETVGEGYLAVPVVYTLAVASAALLAYLLAARATIIADQRYRWLSIGFATAGALALAQGLAIADLATVRLAPTPSGAAGLYLLWHAVLPVFVLGALLSRDRPGLRWSLVGAFGGALAMTLWDPTWAGLPRLVGPDGAFTPVYDRMLLGLLAMQALALGGWLWSIKRRPSRPELWVGVGLLLMLLDLVVASGAARLLEAVWWSSAALRVAQFGVPALGLLGDNRRLLRLLQLHEQSLRDRLERELRPVIRPVPQAVDRQQILHVIREGGVRPVFQPIYSLSSGDVIAVEALARFDRLDLSPDRWFAAAQLVGLRVELELTAARAAIDVARATLPPDVAVSVNVSPSTVVDGRFRQLVDDADSLVIEVTEHDVVDDYARLSDALGELRATGCRVAIDDAGAGFSSLRHIVRLQPDVIKLDMSLTRDIDADPVRRALARCLIDFAEQTDTVLVAEGVERVDELAALQELGAHAAQGYLLGRPEPLTQVGWARREVPEPLRALHTPVARRTR
ncbi:EAL domain-containing protein [Egicoccus sp. AB-alg2]|uniref:EAL domain-containing protein n=1 Tax=Egicoccus sp. AB-alg2 TaxID=3242693 RepID=UPI00359DFB70